jgi:FtsP/CotA-like multicopper oxidase with cupredoxin domain
MWLTSDTTTKVADGPKFTLLSTEGAYLDAPVTLDSLFLAPAERPIVVIDFTGMEGKTFTLMNNALYPFPSGVPPTPGQDDRIMQFIVNGQMVGTDNSTVPANLRSTPLVKLTDFNGNLNVQPVVKRQLLLNEIASANGPVRVAINNSHVDTVTVDFGGPVDFGIPTEFLREGNVELWQFMNTTADAHPMHPHLVQYQIVSRQKFDDVAYMHAYEAAWAANPKTGAFNWPAGGDYNYPGGSGSPLPYNTPNTDGALGGNPPLGTFGSAGSFFTGPPMPPAPEERGWKDALKSFPGEVLTVMVRVAPTDKALNAPADSLIYSFDPSLGPG